MNIAAQPPVQTDQTIYLKDYQKPAFLVESINLDIQVYDEVPTSVKKPWHVVFV